MEACLQFKKLKDCFYFRKLLCGQELEVLMEKKYLELAGNFCLAGGGEGISSSMKCLDLKQLPSSDFC